MIDEGICIGCGGDCLDIIECNCGGQEVYACQECVDSDITLVCGVCRDRAERVVPVSSYPCRDFQDDEAAPVRDMGGRLPVTAPVGAWGGSSRRHDADCSASQLCTGCGWKRYQCCCAPGATSDTYRCDCGSEL